MAMTTSPSPALRGDLRRSDDVVDLNTRSVRLTTRTTRAQRADRRLTTVGASPAA